MPRLNTDYILHGTDEKNLASAHEVLSKSYTKEGAEEYKDNYTNKSLGFILENSRYIFSEPLYGFDFYKTIVESGCMSPFMLYNEKLKFDDYMAENADKMEEDQKKIYTEFSDSLTNKVNSLKKEIALESAFSINEKTYDKVRKFYDTLYEYTTAESKDEKLLEESIGQLTVSDTILHAVPAASAIFEASREIGLKLTNYKAVMESTETYNRNMMKNVIISNIMDSDSIFTESVSNANVRSNLNALSSADLYTMFNESIQETEKLDKIVYTNPFDAVNSLFQEDTMSCLVHESKINELLPILKGKRKAYNVVLEYVTSYNELFGESEIEFKEPDMFTSIKNEYFIKESVNSSEAMELMMKACNDVDNLIREYTEDGSPSKVIKKSHASFREEPKQNTSSSSQRSNASNNFEDDDEDDDDSEGDDSNNQNNEPNTSNANNQASDEIDKASKEFSSNAGATAPVKPKTGVIQKIQNGAMDAHAASQKTGAKLKQAGTAVKNAGKAVLKIPAGILNSAKQMIKNFENMDEDSRKKVMLEPGFRKKWFARMKTLLEYGAAAYAGMMFVPITFIARRMSKERNMRLRNEFVAELETEIKVCEAKIEDASAAGDQQQKYKLMRIRDKLNIERERVLSNSKYI